MRPRAFGLPGLLGIACSVALAAGCKDRQAPDGEGARPAPALPPRPIVPDRIDGTLTLDGKPLQITRCRPGHDDTVYVDLVTAAGALRFVSGESAHMYWNPSPDANERGEPIECSIPHRSWGGAMRPDDGTTYFRGELAFSCRAPAGALEGKLALDCGNITPLERMQLDDGRRRRREATERPGRPAPPPGDRARPPAGGDPARP
jgi:hypothetical protein